MSRRHPPPSNQPDPGHLGGAGERGYGEGAAYPAYAAQSSGGDGYGYDDGRPYGAPYPGTDQSYGSYDGAYDASSYEAYDGSYDSFTAEPGYAAEPPAPPHPGRSATRTAGGSRAVSLTGTRTQVRAAAKARARRKRMVRNSFLGIGSIAAVTVIAVAGLLHPMSSGHSAVAASGPTVDSGRSSSAPVDASRSVTRPTPTTALKQLPGLGATFLAKIPANAQQVFLVTGTGKNASTATAVLYTRTADGTWLPGTSWPAHNAKDGWTGEHYAGDLHSPIGVFSLTDAGGLDANPGTKLPYLHSSAFQALGTGFEGESLADAFDYVVAINYNHVPGTSPLSGDRPLGEKRGGGIWIHVDHNGPTHGCVSLSKANMAILLKDLDPAKHPVIVMGDATSLKA